LIGVIKETQFILITMTVLSAFGDITNFIIGDIGMAILGILITIYTGTYTHTIIKKKETNSAT